MDPATIAALAAAIQSVTGVLKGFNFTGTPHLSWEQAFEQAKVLTNPLVEVWISKHGLSLQSVSKANRAFVEYMNSRRGQASWSREAGAMADGQTSDAANYLTAGNNPKKALDILMWRWVMFCLLNYDARRPDDFKIQFRDRTIELFGIDVEAYGDMPIAADLSKTFTGVVDAVGGFFKNLLGGSPSTGSGSMVSGNTGQLLMAFLLLGVVIYFVTRKN